MRAPKLQSLKMFDAAARHLNFRLAADELNLTQGAIAQSVRGLEADLSVQLFKRLPRGLALTELGYRYHSDVARGLAIIDKATMNLYPQTDALTVSVPPSFASKWLVPRLPYFSEEHPGIEIRTIATETVTDFQTQDVDICVRLGARPPDQNMFVELLASLDLCAVCSPDKGNDLGGIEALEVFTQFPLIQDGHRYWEALFNEASIEHSGHFLQFNQTALAMDAAANGQGFALAPRLLAANELTLGKLNAVWKDDQITGEGFWLLHPLIDRPNHLARSLFVEWLLSECR